MINVFICLVRMRWAGQGLTATNTATSGCILTPDWQVSCSSRKILWSFGITSPAALGNETYEDMLLIKLQRTNATETVPIAEYLSVSTKYSTPSVNVKEGHKKILSLTHPPSKRRENLFNSFCVILLTNQQTNRSDNIASLTEVN